MSWVATAIVGGAVVGGVLQGNAAKSAANAQVQGDAAAIAEQRRQFDITQKNLQPWLTAGTNALSQQQALNKGDYSSFFASPDYNFTRNEGMRGLQQTAAARGGAFSGNALKALSDYNQNLASQQYGNYYNRIAGMSGTGQQTGINLGNLGQQSANSIGSLLAGQGDARASGIVGQANAWGNALGGITNYLGYGGGLGGGGSNPSSWYNWNFPG